MALVAERNHTRKQVLVLRATCATAGRLFCCAAGQWRGRHKNTQKAKKEGGGAASASCCALGGTREREAASRAARRGNLDARGWVQRRVLTANPRPCRRSETSPAASVIAATSPLGIGVLRCRSFQCARMLYFHSASLSAGLRDDAAAAVGALCWSSAYSGWHSRHTIGAFDDGESIVLLLILAICILTPLF